MGDADPRIRPVVAGVAGGSGSGKSTVVAQLSRRFEPAASSVIHHDAYYRDLSHLPIAERARVNFDHPDALETDLLVEHLGTLLRGETADVPTYDFATHTRRRETRRVYPTPLLIVDGILALADARLRDLMDLRVFVDTDADVRLIRRIRRDVAGRGRTTESVIAQWEATVRPMHLEFVEPSKRYADLIVPEGGYNRVGVDMVAERVQAMLTGGVVPHRSEQA